MTRGLGSIPPMTSGPGGGPCQGPHLRAPETSRTVFLVTLSAALVPLVAGTVFFGYRVVLLSVLAVGTCVVLERSYFRVMRAPALIGRSHAVLTGVLLTLTLPPFAPWYVPVVGAAFAILVGKAIFGGVGHFLWQPALLGRLAVAILFGASLNSPVWPLLHPAHAVTGDVRSTIALPARAHPAERTRPWRQWEVDPDFEARSLPRPASILRQLSDPDGEPYPHIRQAFVDLPPIREAIIGSVPGGIGETSAVAILLAGLYLVYRNYVYWALPAGCLLAAAATVAIAPVTLAGPGGAEQAVWFPVQAEGWLVGLTYVSYHLVAGELMLAAFLLAPEMTSRPVTPAGQLLFGIGCGVIGMVLRLYVLFPLSCYLAVLVMNFFTPVLERLTRPRVLGRPPWWRRLPGLHPARR